MKTPQRLLVRSVNWLGDAVMSMPALARLREALPATHIALLTAEKLADLWHGHTSINQVITFNKRDGIGRVSSLLREGRFDTALILPNSFRSAFEPWLAGIPTRIGYGESMRSSLLTHVVPPRPEHIRMQKKSAGEIRRLIRDLPSRPRETFPAAAHHLHQYLRLTSVLRASETPLAPALPIPHSEKKQFIEKFALTSDAVKIGLNPGAEYGPAKRWPIQNFIETALKLHASIKPLFLLFGGPGDLPATTQLDTAIQNGGGSSVNLAGKTTLRELAVGLSLCHAVLTNDTGPMHLAAAVGTRVIVPFGSTSPELTGPGLPGDTRHQLILGAAPCAPCFLRICPIDFRCMQSISPSDAVHAFLSS